MASPGPAGAPPPPAAGLRQGWPPPPPEIQQPPINPDQADDPWASWYGKPRGSRLDTPSATMPRVTQAGGPPRDGQGYGGPGYDQHGYAGNQQYLGSPPYPAAPQQYGTTEAFGAPQHPGQQYDSGQQYGPGPQYGGQPPYPDGGDSFGGGNYAGSGGPTYAEPGGGPPYPGQGQNPYGDPQYGPPTGGPGGPGGPGRRRRGPLILAIGAVAVVVVVVVVVLNSGGGSPSPAASTAAGGASASASASAPATAERAAATQLSGLVSQSGKYRADVNAGVSNVAACKSLRAARTAFGDSAANRKNLLAQLNTLPDRSALPASLLQELTTAWTASIQVDSDLHDWAQDEISGGCDPKKATSDPKYQASLAYDSPATTSKQNFARDWKPIATQFGLPAYEATQL